MSATNTGHDSNTNNAGVPPAPPEAHQRAGWNPIPAKAVKAHFLSGEFFLSAAAQARIDAAGLQLDALLAWFNQPRDAVNVGDTVSMGDGLQAFFGFDGAKSGEAAFFVRIDVEASSAGDSIAALFGEVIASYSRAQAIADGELVDVTEAATEVGFRFPVAMTRSAWADCVAWSANDNRRHQTHQDERGRLHDVVYLASLAVRRPAPDDSERRFNLYRVPRDGKTSSPQWVSLKVVIGPGDDPRPVITIMQPHED